jgi:GNAT superfamily N-acetyltransferase
MAINLIPAIDSDKEYFRSLNRDCYQEVVVLQFGVWDDELQSKGFDLKWKEQKFQKIMIDGVCVGGVWVDLNEYDHQLREIQIHPDYQGQGIGTRIVLEVIEAARHDSRRLWLKVLLQSDAVRLYERLGFAITGKTETQYIMDYPI